MDAAAAPTPASPAAATAAARAPAAEEPPSRAASLAEALETFGPTAAFAALAEAHADAAVFVVDAQRRVVLWSGGAERLLGFTREQAVGRSCLETNRCAACAASCGIDELRTIAGMPLVMQRADGAAVAVRKTARAFHDEQGNFLGGVEVLVADRGPGASVDAELPPGTEAFHGLVTRSPGMLRALEIVRRVAPSDATVLVRGESGTGKELVARAIHAESGRAGRPFHAVNCAAIAPTLLESELFGHARGAFTGAERDRKGMFALADGGTLFLDEVGELSMELQAKLLRVLEERTFTPLGATRPVRVDVRIVGATHRDLRAMAREGRFREDLLYRLWVVPIYVPPLRQRPDDVEPLLWYFLDHPRARSRRHVRSVSPEAMRVLTEYGWPGNARELQNVVEYALAVGAGPQLDLDDLPSELFEVAPAGTSAPGPDAAPIDAGEAERIRRALAEARGNVARAAESLQMSRVTLWRRRKKLGI